MTILENRLALPASANDRTLVLLLALLLAKSRADTPLILALLYIAM